jgi:hypothetical protein
MTHNSNVLHRAIRQQQSMFKIKSPAIPCSLIERFLDEGSVLGMCSLQYDFQCRFATAPQGLFVSVSLRPRLQSFGPRIASQLFVEFAVALGLSLLVLATRLRSSIHAAGFLGLAGLIAGLETHFPNWNWAGFPTSYLLAGSAYLAGSWFITGLVLGAVRRKLKVA